MRNVEIDDLFIGSYTMTEDFTTEEIMEKNIRRGSVRSKLKSKVSAVVMQN